MIREVGDRMAEGFVLGSLADVLMLQGHMGKARELVTEGEILLREVGNSIELAKLLCIRGRAEAIAGDLTLAHALLAECEDVASAMGTGPDSALGREIIRLRGALADSHNR